MKELLTKLGFEHLPTLSGFWNKLLLRPNYQAKHRNDWIVEYYDDYINLVAQPLTKGMFMPCDEDGNVLDKPILTSDDDGINVHEEMETFEWLQYQKSVERVLFEGFEIEGDEYDGTEQYIYSSKENGVFYYPDDEHDVHFSDGVIGIKTIEGAINSGVKLILK